MSTHRDLPPLSQELAHARLGDRRRTERLERIVDAAARAPSLSFPDMAGGDAALEAFYRFLSNDEIEPEAVLAAHFARTAERAAELEQEVLVLHDTTTFELGGQAPREGLGPLRGKGQGFLAHYSLAATLDGQPLGALAMYAWARGEPKGRRSARELQDDEDRESLRWLEGALESAERLAGRAAGVHVMDREGDAYELMCSLLEHDQRFVIRLAHDRTLQAGRRRGDDAPAPKLYSAMASGELLLEREVQLSRRKGAPGLKQAKIHPPRRARTAKLSIRACTLTLFRGQHQSAAVADSIRLNFVEVKEVDPPPGEAPVIWRLVTTESIETPEDVARVVDIYRRRWLAEEFFKAIKTGCAFEKRQLLTGRALIMALVVFSVVAWRLLLLRWMGRNEGGQPATLVLTPSQLEVLGAVRRQAGRPLPAPPACRDVLLAIAALGGHLERNGEPGWQILGRGFEKLLLLEAGWLAAHGAIAEATTAAQRGRPAEGPGSKPPGA